MTTIQLPPAPPASTPSPAEPRQEPHAAGTFLRAQSSWLRRGLEHAGDPTAVGLVLGAHEHSHERWLQLVASLHRELGADAAQTVATLYAHHGRVAGYLERGPGLLDEKPAAVVRTHHAERLSQLTDITIAALARHGQGTDGSP